MPIPAANFNDLLHRANRLLGTVKTDVEQSASINQSLSAPSATKSLSDVFERGRSLWQKTTALDDPVSYEKSGFHELKPGTSLLWGASSIPSTALSFSEKLNNAVHGITSTAGSSNQTTSYRDENLTDLEQFLRNERENILISLIEETARKTSKRVESRALDLMKREWENEKKKLLPTLPSVGMPEIKPNIYMHSSGLALKTSMNEVERKFSEAVSQYIEKSTAGGVPVQIIDLFEKTAESLKKDKLIEIWKQVKCMLDVHIPFQAKNVDAIRESSDFKISSIDQALKYLEKQFLRHMQTIVYGNLEQSQLGGVPGILNLIKAYLNVKLPNGYPTCEDGFLNGHPIWATIHFCLRVGDFQAAFSVCNGYESQCVAEFGVALKQLLKPNTHKLYGDAESKFLLLWRTNGRASQDSFKKSCFCAVALCDTLLEHNDVVPTFEDWIWLKLRQALITESASVDVEPSTAAASSTISKPSSTTVTGDFRNRLPIERLRSQILVDYGEQHFASGDTPLLFWTALWLTGQFEAAIDFLSRQQLQRLSSATTMPYACHALHVALALNETGLLLTPEDADSKLISLKPGESPIAYRFNLARMITLYVSQFQTTNLKDALNYFYFLKYFTSSGHSNLFYAAVNDLLTETKQYELLFGRLDERGNRLPGLINHSRYQINITDMIRYVAGEAVKRGNVEAAVTMYDLIEDHNRTFKLLTDLLCQVISQPITQGSTKDRYTELATRVATRYRDHGYKADESTAVTFFQLMDIVTFFNLFHVSNYEAALDIIRRIKLLPLNEEEIDQFVKEFYMVPDEVRRILPEIILAVMCVFSHQFKEARGSERSFTFSSTSLDETTRMIRISAKALLQYAARIPYRMPGDMAARLVQMETFMH